MIENPEQQTIALINAKLLDPGANSLEPGGLLISDGRIEHISPDLRRNAPKGSKVIDCKGKILAPGLVDMLVYTGAPGQEHRETLATASRSGAGWRRHQHDLHAQHQARDR